MSDDILFPVFTSPFVGQSAPCYQFHFISLCSLSPKTIFEALGKTANPKAYETMQKKRRIHDGIITKVAAENEAKKKKMRLEESKRLADAKAAVKAAKKEQTKEVSSGRPQELNNCQISSMQLKDFR